MENARSPAKEESSAPDSAHSTQATKLTPRQRRLVLHLWSLEPDEWCSREAVDRISGSSNGPEVVRELRAKFGEDAIETQRVDAMDRDGRPCKPGRYRATTAGRQRLAGIVATALVAALDG